MLFRDNPDKLEEIALQAKEYGINVENHLDDSSIYVISPKSDTLRRAIRIIKDFEGVVGVFFGLIYLGETMAVKNSHHVEIDYDNALRKINRLRPRFYERLSDGQLDHIIEKSVDYLESHYGIFLTESKD